MLRKSVAEELAAIQQAHDGLLRPADVVEFAKDPATSLHSHFTWDDTEAARRYRIDQARTVIRLHVTVIEDQAEPVRALVSLSSDRTRGGGYRSTVDVLRDGDRRQEMLADALNELRIVRRKYERLNALRPIWDAIDGLESPPAQATG